MDMAQILRDALAAEAARATTGLETEQRIKQAGRELESFLLSRDGGLMIQVLRMLDRKIIIARRATAGGGRGARGLRTWYLGPKGLEYESVGTRSSVSALHPREAVEAAFRERVREVRGKGKGSRVEPDPIRPQDFMSWLRLEISRLQ